MQSNFNGTLEYGAAISSVEMSIGKIKGIGVDVTSYESKLIQIKKEVNEKLDLCKSSSNEDTNKNINKVYEYGVEKLNSFMEELNKYKAYYQTMNKCMYIYNSQNLSVINESDLSDAVESLIECLGIIKKSNTLTEDINVIKSLYEIVYNIIKLEFKMYGKSKLADYCRKDKIDCVYLSRNILKEIEEVSSENYDTTDIDRIVLKLSSKDGQDLYLDEELLMALSIVKDKELYLKDLCNSIEKLNDKLSKNNLNIDALLKRKETLTTDKKTYKARVKSTTLGNLKSVSGGAIMLLISAGVLFGATTGIIRLAKGNVYMTDREIYSTQTGKTEKTSGYERQIILFSSGEINRTTLMAYDPWVKDEYSGNYKRTVRYIDFYDVNLDSAKDYLDLNLDELGYKYNSNEQTVSHLSPDDLYEESYFEVTKEVQDNGDRQPGKIDEYRWLLVIFLGGISALIYGGIVVSCRDEGAVFGILLSISEILDEIRSFDDTTKDKERLSKIMEEIAQVKQSLSKLINEMDTIKSGYDDVLRKPESKKLLERYQKGIELLEEYGNQLNNSNELVLKVNKG